MRRSLAISGAALVLVAVVGVGVAFVSRNGDATPAGPPTPTATPRAAPTALPAPVDAGALAFGATREVSLPGGAWVTFTISVTEPTDFVATVRAVGVDTQGFDLDPVAELLDEVPSRVAYNDDALLASLGPNDAQLTVEALPPGDYTLRVNTFNGAQAGTLSVMLGAPPDKTNRRGAGNAPPSTTQRTS